MLSLADEEPDLYETIKAVVVKKVRPQGNGREALQRLAQQAAAEEVRPGG